MMKNILKLLLIIIVIALLLTGCTSSSPKGKGYRSVSMKEAMEMMEKETNYIILDVRTEGEYKAGHIPGAILLPNETIGSEQPSQLPDKEQLILVYCRSGNRSKQASAKLAKLDYTNIVEIGGISSWPGEIVTD